jgi:hypothetical protein
MMTPALIPSPKFTYTKSLHPVPPPNHLSARADALELFSMKTCIPSSSSKARLTGKVSQLWPRFIERLTMPSGTFNKPGKATPTPKKVFFLYLSSFMNRFIAAANSLMPSFGSVISILRVRKSVGSFFKSQVPTKDSNLVTSTPKTYPASGLMQRFMGLLPPVDLSRPTSITMPMSRSSRIMPVIAGAVKPVTSANCWRDMGSCAFMAFMTAILFIFLTYLLLPGTLIKNIT